MNRPTSLYLDLVRFTAAVAVFISHTSAQRVTAGLLWQAEPYGDEAVDVFFVLSGFVIAYVTSRGEADASSFALARLARIYSVALPALATTVVLDGVGRWLRPDLYPAWWGYHAATDGVGTEFLASLFFVNHVWWLQIGQGSNVAYWSLTYEVWYYAIFGLFMFGGSRRMWLSAALALTAGPNIIVLFPLWLLGVLTFRVCSTRRVAPRTGAALVIGAFIVWMVWEVAANHYHLRHAGPKHWLSREQLYQDYVIGPLFAVHLVGFVALSHLVAPMLERFARPIRWTAGATFTIYLFHAPITQFLTTVVPWPLTSWQTRMIMFVGVPILMFAIASLTERRKDAWRALFSAMFRVARLPLLTE